MQLVSRTGLPLPHVHRKLDPGPLMQRHAGQTQYDRGQRARRAHSARPAHGSLWLFISSSVYYLCSLLSFSLLVPRPIPPSIKNVSVLTHSIVLRSTWSHLIFGTHHWRSIVVKLKPVHRMHSIYYDMDRKEVLSHERLEILRSSAFESEHAWQYDTSYMEHEAAAIALEQEIEQSLASISPDENSDEQIRIIKTQITIHRERQRALKPHLESGSGDFDGWGNECTFVPAPNQWGANGDLDDDSETLSSVRHQGSPRRFTQV